MYVAEVPDLKGCYAEGETVEKALANLKDVIAMCLEKQKGDVSHHELIGVQTVEVAV